MAVIYKQPRTSKGLARLIHAWKRPAPNSQRWESDPDLRALNGGKGSCNTGADIKGACVLGGLGCNVDHDYIEAVTKE